MEDARVQNPRQTAGFLSLLTFSWISNVLKLGSKQPLEEKHLFSIEASNQTEKLVGVLEREWMAEERASEQKRTKPRLWRAMMRLISYRDYIILGLLRLFYSITFNTLPLIMWFFLRSISSVSEISYGETLSYVIGMSVVSIARSVCVSQAAFKMDMEAVRLKAATIGFVYKKASKVEVHSILKTTTKCGKNLFSVDCSIQLFFS